MSRLLSKLSPHIHKTSRRTVRSFSSSAIGPCAPICSILEQSPDGGNVGEVLLFNLRNLELVRTEKTYPRELSNAQLVGASHGWGCFSNIQDGSVVISDFLLQSQNQR
ncbi:hypothetical protein V5N11_018504 [Cardamine amara subsp. amara]|uniref:Uncharacterized protein n=1 Tax=Cardamine amara subsp. amara TaxID=228776 RepID=A0ABD0ZP40_CARAN